MPSAGAVLLCGVAALLYWGLLGLALSWRLAPISLSRPIAPALGWALHSALALPIYRVVGFTAWTVGATSLLALIAAWVFCLPPAFAEGPDLEVRVPFWAYALAAVLAAVPAIALFPKIHGDMVTLAPSIFDHSKVAIIDEMTRLGLPPGNPFFGEAGQQTTLSYYYLWHFSAAELALVFGMSGWEADIVVTAFTAFASLALMMGFAVWIVGRPSAAGWVVPFAFAASLQPVLEVVLGTESYKTIFLPPTGLGGWLFQTTWAPQHIASASCVLLSSFFLVQLSRWPSTLTATVLAVVIVAGYESSTWVGGIQFAIAAPLLTVILMTSGTPETRSRFVIAVLVAALLALALAFPFLRDQATTAAARTGGVPLGLHPYAVLNLSGRGVSQRLDIPGYWLGLLVIEFPAIYLPGLVSIVGSLRSKILADEKLLTTKVLFGLMLASLLVSACVSLTFADNNDLAWRAVLPAVFVLNIFAATGLSRWMQAPAPVLAGGVLLLLLLGLPKSFELVGEDVHGLSSSANRAFGATPTLWDAVRRHTAPDERIANNPLFMKEMTPWPVNISWALLSDRRSCFAGRELVLPFTTLSRDRIAELEGQFRRVFRGQAEPNDVKDLATRYLCRVAVLTSQDGAWNRDPFAGSGFYSLAEEKSGEWKIYRVTGDLPHD